MRIVAAIAVVTLCLSGCLESKEPLCSAQHYFIDRTLLGKWKRINGSGTLEISQSTPNSLLLLVKEHGLAMPKERDKMEFSLVLCKTTIATYANLRTSSVMDEEKVKKGIKGSDVFSFYRYHIDSDGTLSVRSPAYNALKEAVDRGELRGKAWATTWGENVTLTEAGPRMQKWFDRQNESQAFGEATRYQRVTQ